jgi:hypothetical protein
MVVLLKDSDKAALALAAKPKTTSNTNKFFISTSPSSKTGLKVYALYTSIHFSVISGSIFCRQSAEKTCLNTS